MLEKTYESPSLYELHPIASWICIIGIFLFIFNIIILIFSKKEMTFTVLITMEFIIGLIIIVFFIFLLKQKFAICHVLLFISVFISSSISIVLYNYLHFIRSITLHF